MWKNNVYLGCIIFYWKRWALWFLTHCPMLTSYDTLGLGQANLVQVIAFMYLRPLQWRHNGRSGISNHQPHDCLLNRLFRHRSKKTSKLRVTGLWKGISPVVGEFPAQRASNVESVSIWWRHHANVDLISISPTALAWRLFNRKCSTYQVLK